MEKKNIYCIVNAASKMIAGFIRDKRLEHGFTGTLNLKETTGLRQSENLADSD